MPDAISSDTAKMLKGAFALLVLSHHVYQHLNLCFPFRLMADDGPLWVSGFFFLSGYGLYKSFAEKEHYLKGFLWKRLLKIYIPFALVNAVQLALRLFAHARISTKDALLSFVFSPLLDSNHWFIITILIFYVGFYLAFRFLPKKAAFPALFIWVLAYFVVTLSLIPEETWWYNAVFALPIGMGAAALPSEKLRRAFARKWGAALTLTLLFFGISMVAGLNRPLTFQFLLDHAYAIASTSTIRLFINGGQVLFASLFAIFLALSLQKFAPNNRLLRFFGEISLELYLIHGGVIYFLKTLLPDMGDDFFALGTLLLSVLFAATLHTISKKILSLIIRRNTYVSGR